MSPELAYLTGFVNGLKTEGSGSRYYAYEVSQPIYDAVLEQAQMAGMERDIGRAQADLRPSLMFYQIRVFSSGKPGFSIRPLNWDEAPR